MKKRPYCPHWGDDGDRICHLKTDGIYLPLPEHVIEFCTTPHYSECNIFQTRFSVQDSRDTMALLSDQTADKRRQYPRITDRFQIMISRHDTSGSRLEVLDSEAYTLDYSMGGICFTCKEPLAINDLIIFNFLDDFILPDFSGVGEVKWNRPTDTHHQKSGYEVGMAFVAAAPGTV